MKTINTTSQVKSKTKPAHARRSKPVSVGNAGDVDYHRFLDDLQVRFLGRLARGPLFTTAVEGLWEAYLGAFPIRDRQYHTCSACRRFIETFGGLVTIDEDGTAKPAIWDTEMHGVSFEAAAVAVMAKLVRRSAITGVFLSKEPVWGQPLTGDWRHMALTPPSALVYRERALTAGQAMAEKREDFKNVSRALGEYTAPIVNQALALLKADALYRSEKVLGPCQFLADLHAQVADMRHRFPWNLPGKAQNHVWRAVALAPAGFCHPRSSMVGTLLDDIASGLPFNIAAERFGAKMHQLQYQRPQAAPSAGNIQAAEKLVEKLGIERSLERRFARLDEIDAIWRPTPTRKPAPAGGVFSHLAPKGTPTHASSMSVPRTGPMTWAKFARDYLGDAGAEALEMWVPTHGNYTAILTANDPDAPPILQWDHDDGRNPFSTYVYHAGSNAYDWNLVANAWANVTAVTTNVHQWWGGKFPHQEDGIMLILEGAKDSRTGQGNAIFPETLKNELHAVRATIEAYSRRAVIQGREEASACGLSLRGGALDCRLRVTDRNGIKTEIRIDRLE